MRGRIHKFQSRVRPNLGYWLTVTSESFLGCRCTGCGISDKKRPDQVFPAFIYAYSNASVSFPFRSGTVSLGDGRVGLVGRTQAANALEDVTSASGSAGSLTRHRRERSLTAFAATLGLPSEACQPADIASFPRFQTTMRSLVFSLVPITGRFLGLDHSPLA